DIPVSRGIVSEVACAGRNRVFKGAKKDEDKSSDQSTHNPYLFEENFRELKKWVDVESPKYGILLVVTCEKRAQRLGTALK
ncbi:hypothetical protein S83_008824, partial [Arachis hypogaea]